MKTRLKVLGLVCFLLAANCTYSQQQPQWKFHLAFEDALGRKDTIFLIYDSLATFGMDSIFGEYPAQIIDTTFQVFFGAVIGGIADSFKVLAQNFNGGLGVGIYAINYVLPITITWDSSLFHCSNLPYTDWIKCAELSSYYFWSLGLSVCQNFNMLETNTVTLPYGANGVFGIQTNIGGPVYCCIDGIDESKKPVKKFEIYPNPFDDFITILEKGSFNIRQISIHSIDGRLITKTENENNLTKIIIPLHSCKQGIYLIEIHDNLNNKFYEKIIKY